MLPRALVEMPHSVGPSERVLDCMGLCTNCRLVTISRRSDVSLCRRSTEPARGRRFSPVSYDDHPARCLAHQTTNKVAT